MARKQAGKSKMEETADPKLKPVRVDLAPDIHHLLRLVAASEDLSMAAYARMALERDVREVAKRKGIKG